MRWALVIVPLCWCTSDTTPPYEDDVKSIGSSADDEGYSIASEMLRNSIDFSVDPCEDFFEFACGNWVARHPLLKDEVSYSYIKMLNDKMQKEIRTMYESNDTFGSKAINAMKAFYRKCMDEDELNRIGAKQMIENVKSFGVWPALEGDDTWKEEKYNLTLLLIHVFRHRKTFPFITFYPTEDEANVRRLLQFERGKLFLDKSYYLDPEENRTSIGLLKKRLISEIEQFQKDGGLPTNRSKTEKDVDEIIDLEMRIAKIMDADVTDNNTYIPHLKQMKDYLPQVDWSQLFRAVAPSSQRYFDSDPEVFVTDVEYMYGIAELLQSTDPRIITNYIFMWFVALYVKEALHKTTKEDITKTADDLLEEFRKKLKVADWIDDETRTEALNKVDHMLRQIAYPKFVLDIGMLDKHYRDLDVHDTDSFSEMWEKLFRWHIEHFFERLIRKLLPAFFNLPFFITHSQGRFHDAFGERHEWWNEEVKKRYVQRAQCLIDQYGKIEVPETGLNISGELTLSENIADNGGVRLAYEHGQEERIKGLEQFDNEQMFFLGWATMWCSHQTNDSLIDTIRTDEHSPKRYRVNQVLANMPEFAAAFL